MPDVDIKDAQVGDMVNPNSLPPQIVGGGWVGRKYVCRGAHKDGRYGWQCKEIR